MKTSLLKKAYKKLKSSVYYDKTQLILRDELVKFEKKSEDIDKKLEKMAKELSDESERAKLIDEILDSISYNAFPKKIDEKNGQMIKNYFPTSIEVKEKQYFINMDVRGHILGVLWLMLIGYKVDKDIYRNSFGNRIRKKLYNEFSEQPTYSPYLFEPYFQQYESWRDTAMDRAMEHLHAGQDVVILTLDFKQYYYSLDISKVMMDNLLDNYFLPFDDNYNEIKALNDFIYSVIHKYASLFKEFDSRDILPIGFLPSNVLANYALKSFDQAILDGWNPIYFGRYVDDVLIVDKIEHNSDLFIKSQNDELTSKDVIDFFFRQCSGWKGIGEIGCKYQGEYALFNELDEKKSNEKECQFVLNKIYNPGEKNNRSQIIVKNEKVKVFYFRSDESDALITCFRETIAKNKSEFRHMPEDEAVFQYDDYSQIYDLNNTETINKFRGISGVSIDKYELSKLLGKHLRICGLISDKKETKFEKEIDKIFNHRVLIENYIVWEKVIEILVINESFDLLKKYIERVKEAIEHLSFKKEDSLSEDNMKNTLLLYLYSALSRSLALVWGNKVDIFIEEIEKKVINVYSFQKQRKGYCNTRLIDKSVMPIFIDMLSRKKIYNTKETVNLSSFLHVLPFCEDYFFPTYIYYPYLITMYDFSIMEFLLQAKEKTPYQDIQNIIIDQKELYIDTNYQTNQNYDLIDREWNKLIQISRIKYNQRKIDNAYCVSVDGDEKKKLKIAIANVRLDHDNFEKLVKDNPNRSYKRYQDLSKVVNEAINEKVDMLIMPESYIPFEWLTTLARTCARNKIAVVTGIEHVKIDTKIFNLTAVILPYEDIMSNSAYISFHLKTHYAPLEKEKIEGYRLQAVKGNNYELYKWCNCYFPVYCCYELTSIIERSIFQSYADFLVAIEWNKDVNYYSNILESLSRDIHCYCIQVNSSDYGDSRITKPSRTEEKDIIKTKGGMNSTILVGEIDIESLREFQIKEYSLQRSDKRFKSTPPGFDPYVVMAKIKNENLFFNINNEK